MSWDDDEADLPDEREPEALRRKWQEEEYARDKSAMQACRHCGQPIAADSFSCLYCGDRVFEKSGLLGRMNYFVRSNRIISGLFLVIVAMFALFWLI